RGDRAGAARRRPRPGRAGGAPYRCHHGAPARRAHHARRGGRRGRTDRARRGHARGARAGGRARRRARRHPAGRAGAGARSASRRRVRRSTMSAPLPLLPETAPFAREHIEALNAVMARTNAEQRHWLSGFLAGYHAATAGAQPAVPAAPPRARIPLTILFATESGNAEGVGADLKKAAARQGFAPKLLDMADVAPADLAEE